MDGVFKLRPRRFLTRPDPSPTRVLRPRQGSQQQQPSKNSKLRRGHVSSCSSSSSGDSSPAVENPSTSDTATTASSTEARRTTCSIPNCRCQRILEWLSSWWHAIQILTDPAFLWGCVYRVMAWGADTVKSYLLWDLFLHMLSVVFCAWLAGRLNINPVVVIMLACAYVRDIERKQRARLIDRLRRSMEDMTARQAPASDSETAEWVNGLVEKAWPAFFERFISSYLVDCLHLNLNYYKPKVLKKLLIDTLHLGKLPPKINSVRFFRSPEDGDDCALELDVEYVAAEDMKVDLTARLKRKGVGLGLSGKLYGNNVKVVGRIRLGMRFVPHLPFLGQLRVSFVEDPLLGFSIKPLHAHAIDLNDLPGIATWVDKALKGAVQLSMVEPQQLVFDLVKLLGFDGEVDVSDAAPDLGRNSSEFRLPFRYWRLGSSVKLSTASTEAYAFVEIIEAKDLPPTDQHSSLDPYVKIKFGKLRCRTTVRKQALNPRWQELFRLRIANWDTAGPLRLFVKDRDAFEKDDDVGSCEVDLSKLRSGGRREVNVRLRNVAGRGTLRIGVTIIETGTVTSMSRRSSRSNVLPPTEPTSSSPLHDPTPRSGGANNPPLPLPLHVPRTPSGGLESTDTEEEESTSGGAHWWWRSISKDKTSSFLNPCPKCGYRLPNPLPAPGAGTADQPPTPNPPLGSPSPLPEAPPAAAPAGDALLSPLAPPVAEAVDLELRASAEGEASSSPLLDAGRGGAIVEEEVEEVVKEEVEAPGRAVVVTPGATVRDRRKNRSFSGDVLDFRPLSAMMGAGMGLLGKRLKFTLRRGGDNNSKRGELLPVPLAIAVDGTGSSPTLSRLLANTEPPSSVDKDRSRGVLADGDMRRAYSLRGPPREGGEKRGVRLQSFSMDTPPLQVPEKGMRGGGEEREGGWGSRGVQIVLPFLSGGKKGSLKKGGGSGEASSPDQILRRGFFKPRKTKRLRGIEEGMSGGELSEEIAVTPESVVGVTLGNSGDEHGEFGRFRGNAGLLSPSLHPLEGRVDGSLTELRDGLGVDSPSVRSKDDSVLPSRRVSGVGVSEIKEGGGGGAVVASPTYTLQMYLAHMYHSPSAGTLG